MVFRHCYVSQLNHCDKCQSDKTSWDYINQLGPDLFVPVLRMRSVSKTHWYKINARFRIQLGGVRKRS